MSSSAPAPTSRSVSCAREARARVSSRVVLALDQGTSGTTDLVVAADGRVIARGYAELPQYYPQPGWVEHDPEEIWATVGQAATAALAESRVRAADVAAVGVANQRGTTIVWDRPPGPPIHAPNGVHG